MKVILARHGQTTGDIENRYGGDYDDDMTDLGRQQAEVLAEQLVGQKITKIYTSPLKRAQQTAHVIAGATGVRFEVLPGFKERNSYGILTGLIKQEAAVQHPKEVELLKDVHKTISGAEEYDVFKSRIANTLRTVMNQPHDCVLVITHGGPISTISRDILHTGETVIADCGYMVLLGEDITSLKVESKFGVEFRS